MSSVGRNCDRASSVNPASVSNTYGLSLASFAALEMISVPFNASPIRLSFPVSRMRSASAISREEMVSLFYEYIQSKGIAVEERADLAAFPDSGSVSAAASEAMSWAVAVGLVSGDGAEKLLLPAKGTSRATCAVMISRLCEKYFPGSCPPNVLISDMVWSDVM